MPKKPETELTDLLETGLDVKDRTLFLTGDVNDEMATKALMGMRILSRQPSKPVEIILSSRGGEDDAGWAVYDAIAMSPCKTIITGYGPVMSMAVAILQAGSVRRLMPFSRLLLHPGQAFAELDSRAFVSFGKEVEFQGQQYLDVLAMHSQISRDDVQKLILSDTFMSAWDAVRAGLADEVIEP
jgi:ATP-dependent Clp protease protease subunit